MRLRPETTGRVLTVIVGWLCLAATGRAQTVRYVDVDANLEPPDGSSWCHAYRDLAEALDALEDPAEVDEIRVAAGIYRPSTSNQVVSFQLVSGVAIYGGFAGCGEADENARDFTAYETILSGDLSGNDDPTPASNCCIANGTQTCDDGDCADLVEAARGSCGTEWDALCGAIARVLCPDTCGNRAENSWSVVNASGVDSTAVLDGFTITGGHADGSNPRGRGAGIWIYNYLQAGSPTISNCIIRGNTAVAKGAGMYIYNTGVHLTNCLFTDNLSPRGSAIWSHAGSPVLTNCTISENTAWERQGGILNSSNDSPTLTNCILWGNHDDSGLEEYAQMNLGAGTDLTLTYSCIQGLTGLFGGIGNTGADPGFVDPDGADNVPGTADDDFRLSAGSPLINTGDPSFSATPTDQDLNNQTRLQGCRVDLGAYETGTVQLQNDFDGDGDWDLADFAAFQLCFPTATKNPDWLGTCLCVFDADAGDEVDLEDYSGLADNLTGPDHPVH